ncbi:tetratricopeptide repeat protein [Kitasatospora sp. NPDC052868]|uniref:tetratricopeptide repeat protein n=1 Tax=Kitasatospora sp. NPDC052868 TaxID=3364060 RepID=UPI0037CA2DBD
METPAGRARWARRARVGRALAAGGLVLACAGGLLALGPRAAAPGGPVRAAPPVSGAADRVEEARTAVERQPQDPSAWARLALARLDRSRLTLDAADLAAAEQALHRSLGLRPERNYDAVAGLGQLANARHEFGAAGDYGRQATAMAPDRPAGYAVLADAEIQLGDYPAATAAAQRLLDLAPTVAGYTRAAYDLETHGRAEEARLALERALESASTPADRAFCAHRLGDLAWESGRTDDAEQHYRRALAAAPGDQSAEAGLARVLAAQGRTAQAAQRYRSLTERAPTPQFLLEYAELLLADGQPAQQPLTALAAEARLLAASGGPVDPQLGLYLADHGDPAAAVALLRGERAARHSVLVADALGWALHRAGRDEEAIGHLREAARTGWHSTAFDYHLGAVEHALGLPEAAGHLRQALTRNPRFSPYHAPRAAALLDEGSE